MKHIHFIAVTVGVHVRKPEAFPDSGMLAMPEHATKIMPPTGILLSSYSVVLVVCGLGCIHSHYCYSIK